MKTRLAALALVIVVAVCATLAAPGLAAQGASPPSSPRSRDVGAGSGLTTEHLFDGNTLHDVWIHMNQRDWAELRRTFEEDTYYPCDFEWRGIRAYNAGCRSRGAYTRNGIKPGLRVEFDHYVTGQTFLGLRSLVLRNFWQDPSMLKERIVMQVFRHMGVAASREAHTRLFIGADRGYAGVYALVEDINVEFLARDFNADGYLYEYRWMGPWGFEDLGDELEAYQIRFEPKTHETGSVYDLYAPIRNLIFAINAAGPDDLESALEPYLDVRAFLMHVAVENYVSNWDGLLGTWGLNNFYVNRPPGSPRSALIPWDQDNTFVWLDMPPWHNVEANVLMRKAWASPPLRAFYLRQLVAISALSGWMLDEIDREAAQIREAAAADPLKNSTTAEFEEAVEELKLFALRRPGIVRRYLQLAAPLR